MLKKKSPKKEKLQTCKKLWRYWAIKLNQILWRRKQAANHERANQEPDCPTPIRGITKLTCELGMINMDICLIYILYLWSKVNIIYNSKKLIIHNSRQYKLFN